MVAQLNLFNKLESFLEHASQLGIRKIIKPHLSPEAKQQLR